MKKKLYLVLLAVLLGIGQATAAKKPKTVVASTLRLPQSEIFYNEGIAAMEKGNYDEAIFKFSAS
ncbi:MAG: hypothetical protein J6Z12_04060, partial [Paludibacteraceae bacterium]|nr:hypothetical protein [Paludibacteraceae bacterium]